MADLLDAEFAELSRNAPAPDPASRVAGRPAPMPIEDLDDQLGSTYSPRSSAQEGVSLPAAGWYTDPRDAAQRRWWDGAQWTNHVRPVVSSPVRLQQPPAQARSASMRSSIQDLAADLGGSPRGAVAAAAAHGRHAAQTAVVAPARPGAARPAVSWAQLPTPNGPARASLVLGILSILVNPVLVLSVIAFVTGGAGLARAAGGSGRRQAIAGLVLGVVGALVWAGLTAWLVMNPAILGIRTG